MNKLTEIVEVVAKSLVDNPDAVVVTETEEDGNVYLELSVAKEDMGKIIGKHGKVAKALRTVLKAAAIVQDIHVDLSIV